MPPENSIVIEAALGFMAVALLAIIGVGWSTRELVRDIHANVNHPRSGLDALWRKMDDVLRRLTALERERHASPPATPNG